MIFDTNMIKNKIFIKNYQPAIFFASLVLIITFPLWKSGYLFLLDWGIASGAVNIWEHSILQMLLIRIGSCMHYGLFQKILLSVMLYLLGLGGYFLAKQIVIDEENITIKKLIPYIGGVFIMVNPFTYARLVDGQWFVILGMIGIVFMIAFFLQYWYTNMRSDMICAIFCASISVMFLQHAIFMICMISIIYYIYLWKKKKTPRVLIWPILLLCIVIFMNINVFVGYIFVNNRSDIIRFDDSHVKAFHVVDNGYASIYTNVLSLHGYWGEREHRFKSTQENTYLWKPIFFLFLMFIICGIWHERKNNITWFLTFVGIGAYFLSMGTEGLCGSFAWFLYLHVPFYIGLRESQKWTLVLVIVFVLFFLQGARHVMQYNKTAQAIYLQNIILIVLIFLYTPTLYWGFRGQLLPQDFPHEWYDVRMQFGCDNDVNNILFLPWHQYMKMDFLNGKKIANPANGFFGSCVISGDNIEANHVFTQKNNYQSAIIAQFADMQTGDNTACAQFIQNMHDFSVKRIILTKSEDFEKYAWIGRCESVFKIYDGDFLNVYNIK